MEKINIKLKVKKDFEEINALAIPLILNSITSMIIGLVDQAMVGRISIASFGAVGIVAPIINNIAGVLGMTSVAFNIIAARKKGQGKDYEFKSIFIAGIYLSIMLGTVFFILSLVLGNSCLEIIFGLRNDILNASNEYLRIFSLSVGLNMILFMVSAYLKIVKKTKYIFFANISASLLNLILDYLFIFGKFGLPKMGVKGAALASILALILNLIIYLFIIKNEIKIKYKNLNLKKNIREIIQISIPLMSQEVLEDTIFLIVINAILARVGSLEVAVYSLLSGLIGIALMPMYAYSSAALNLVSESWGKEEYEKIYKIPVLSLIMVLIFFLIISIGFLVFKSELIGLITNDSMLIKTAQSFVAAAILANIFNLSNTVYKSTLQGLREEKKVLRISVFVNSVCLGLMFILSLVFNIGLLGVYYGRFISFFISTIALYVIFKRKRFDNLYSN